MCKYSSLVTRVTNPCPHVSMVIYMTAMTVNECSLLLIGLLLVGCSGHRCGCSNNTTALVVGRHSLLPVGLLLVGHSKYWCGCSESWGALMPLHQWGLLPKGELQRTRLSMSSISSRAYFATHMNKCNN